ncbi:MAG: hypothetical protein HKN09_00745 [Saprospiraceae bacterium]|nr:hypothetical protein [Saprospiraceae bacterium]
MKYSVLVAIAFCFAACTTTKPVSELTDNDIVFTLQKGGCFGECPVYIYNIYNSGHSEFIGQMNTDKIGTHHKTLDKAVYKELVRSFKDANFHEFDDFYESNIADLPLITMSFHNSKTLKTIKGKRERPTELHRLQFKLEQIAESTEGWTLIDEDPTKQDTGPKYIKTQIVLKLKHGNQLAKWFNKMRTEHGIRILKRLSTDDDAWLVSYDTRRYAPERMLEIFRSDPNVASADFNVEAQNK